MSRIMSDKTVLQENPGMAENCATMPPASGTALMQKVGRRQHCGNKFLSIFDLSLRICAHIGDGCVAVRYNFISGA